MLKGSVGWDDYDDRHPVFGKTRNDTNYAVFGMLTRSNLFGQDYLFGTVMAGCPVCGAMTGLLLPCGLSLSPISRGGLFQVG